ncbi:hypothetical protein [uncultured Desulfobacter sp.]|jgi:F-type H+-transporting ATPase subunit b|uniref:F0F1 ATP synthase subunit B family protein n=1 Tax=uncultured Desulfobacter sp. TaxID=240139 RepID=UPI0029C78398|nr:hypothetical protein [uncultured Desulfobacter sp.]
MLIDGFTTIAQVINFLLLVYLLHRFLYAPIIRVMDEREKKIAQTLAQAKLAEETAKQNALELEKEKQLFFTTKEKRMAEVRHDIEMWRDKQMAAVKDEIENLRQASINKLESDQQTFLNALKTQVTRQVISISEKAMKDLAEQRLENRIIFVFLEKVKALEQKIEMKNYTGEVRVTSGFDVAPEMTTILSEKFSEWFPKSQSVVFHRSEALGLGIEVTVGDHKTVWNLNNYLKNLENDIRSHLKADFRQAA